MASTQSGTRRRAGCASACATARTRRSGTSRPPRGALRSRPAGRRFVRGCCSATPGRRARMRRRRVVAHNDFEDVDRTGGALAGRHLPALPHGRAGTPALYLGFDWPLPVDRVGILFDIEAVRGEERGPALRGRTGTGSRGSRSVVATTRRSTWRQPGIVQLIGRPDSRPARPVRVEGLQWLRPRWPTMVDRRFHTYPRYLPERRVGVAAADRGRRAARRQHRRTRPGPRVPPAAGPARARLSRSASRPACGPTSSGGSWSATPSRTNRRLCDRLEELLAPRAPSPTSNGARSASSAIARKRVREVWMPWTERPHLASPGRAIATTSSTSTVRGSYSVTA